MLAQTLGYRTDLALLREFGILEERERYVVARTPSNPTFYFGNFLLYRQPPGGGALATWECDFRMEFPHAGHIAFGWDDPRPGAVAQFMHAGYALQELLVLRADTLQDPPRRNQEITVRPLCSDAEWQAACESQIRNRPSFHRDEARYRAFKGLQMETYRALTQRGLGAWFGAFSGSELVGNFGIFLDGNAARYQQVEVDQPHRRQGICGTMLQAGAIQMRERFDIRSFVIVAEAREPAASIYRSIGFHEEHRQWALWKSGA